MPKKKRKSQYRVAQPRNTERERAENGIVASHDLPTTLASRALTPRVINTMKVADGPKPEELPNSVARQILAASNSLDVDPDKLPPIPEAEVNRIIRENPHVALEGLTRLGKVLPIPHHHETVAFDPTDLKARVIGDLHAGHVDDIKQVGKKLAITDVLQLRDAVTIDVQSVYDRWMSGSSGSDMYTLKMAPPWNHAMLVYNNSAGNVWVMHLVASDLRSAEWDEDPSYRAEMQWQPQPPATHTVDWDRVRWIYSVQVYCGGMGQRQRDEGVTPPQWVPTMGPLMIWRFAIYDDGEPADIHWTHIAYEIEIHKFNNALGVLTEAINMCNCVNVVVARPDRPMPRAQRRRLDRMGVSFSEIHVRPTSKSYRGKGVALADMDMPLHGVRGHYAEFGVNGKGLLFGKLAGRFWIPPHVRGSAEAGTSKQSYTVE